MDRLIFIVIILMVITPAFAGDNSTQEQINRGFDYIQSGKYQKAAEVFNTVITEDRNNVDAYFGLGISYLKLGDNEAMTNSKVVQKAISAFNKALTLRANFPEVYYSLGLCYLALHDKETAIKMYETLKDLDIEIANKLLVRIDAYKQPEQYMKIG